ARPMGPISLAGILFGWSGLALWKSLPAVYRKSVRLAGAAWVLGLVYCSTWFIKLNGRFGVAGKPGRPFDEEVVMFVFIPTAILFLMAIQIVFLRKKIQPEA
ncbi:MAG: hypothetical protein AAF492_05815, partial [Verrucomicrobiota bacterium]